MRHGSFLPGLWPRILRPEKGMMEIFSHDGDKIGQ
jgi:hypothetical protein